MNNNDELYHFGIKGMKWRNKKAMTPEEILKQRSSKKEYKSDVKTMRKALSLDKKNKGMTTDSVKMYAELRTKKGKKYADKVTKSANSKIRNVAIGTASVAAAATIGRVVIGPMVQKLVIKRTINGI